MIWDDFAILENMRIWKREKELELFYDIDGGPLDWYALLCEAVYNTENKNKLPPIYFPSPRLCRQFIDSR